MITQYQLLLEPHQPCRTQQEWGYRLYAALLEEVGNPIAADVHQDSISPISQYIATLDGYPCWTVNLLNEEWEQAAGEVLQKKNDFFLKKDQLSLVVRERRMRTISDVEGLFLKSGEQHKLQFQTPAAFKSKGKYITLPTQRLILQSLIKKWNGCLVDCPIEDTDGEGLDALAVGLRVTQFRLQNQTYHLKGNHIPGFIGSLVLENELSGFHRKLADALLYFSEFAGIGIKTTLGMGGVAHTRVKVNRR